MTNTLSAAKSENLKSSKPEWNNTSSNKSGAATAANLATSSSLNRRATGPRTPQGKLEIVLVENLATLLWRKRRLLQVETAEIEKAQFLNLDLALQNRLDELEYAQLKGASDAKLGRSNPLLLIRNAIEILKMHRMLYMADDSQHQDAILRT